MMDKHEARNTRPVLLFLERVLFISFLIFAVLFVRRVAVGWSQRQQADDMRKLIYSSARAEEALEPAEPLPEMVVAMEQGEDVVGILTGGEEMALYVVQGEDNDFYLTHNASGEYSDSGAAFLDSRCSLDPRDTHIMIHGHNMRSGAIFGDLDEFRKPEYVEQYPVFQFTTAYNRDKYVPYAIADINVDPNMADYYEMPRFKFETDEEFLEFADGLKARSMMDLPIDVQPGDELLSLVTCSYNYDDGRMVVALRKLRADENEEEIIKSIQDAL